MSALPIIFTDELSTAAPVLEELERRGTSAVVFSSALLANNDIGTSVFSSIEGDYAVLTRDGQPVRVQRGSRVWRWKTGTPGVDDVLDQDPAVNDMRVTQYRSALRSLWEVPADWMNPYSAERRLDQNKSLGARLARRSGMSVPDTLITDDPDAFRRFVEERPGICFAVKPAAGWAARRSGGEAVGAYTVRLDRIAALEVADSVRYAPVVVQPYIEKKFELRVTCVGSRLFACRIDSQSAIESTVDWRLYPEHPVEHSAYLVSGKLDRAITAFMQSSGLVYGAIDLIVTPGEDVVFLEMNPSGQYLWIEHLTGLEITKAMADWLCDGGA